MNFSMQFPLGTMAFGCFKNFAGVSQAGYRKPKVCGKFTLMRYQGLATWRGVGIAFDTSKFCMRAKKACEQVFGFFYSALAPNNVFGLGHVT